jgi:hypothetical protein
MQVRITEPGWANFTGQFGFVNFTDGVSDDIGHADAANLAALVQVENIADGHNPSVAQTLLDNANTPAEVVLHPTADTLPAPVLPVFSEDELVAAADKGGIKALRALVEPLGINGTSVAQIVGKTLQLQADRLAREAQAAEAPAAE